MMALGLSPGGRDDPLEASVLLKQGFEFSWTASRSRLDPSTVMMDPEMRPVLRAKADFVTREDFLEQISSVLPDFLSQRSPRPPAPRAKWKSICTADPANVGEMEQQLARLVEQALWAMASDPAFGVEEQPPPVAEPTEVNLEPWMEEHDARVRTAAGKRRGRKARAPPPPLELVKEEGRAEPVVLASHYWGVESREEARDAGGQEEGRHPQAHEGEAQGPAAAAAAGAAGLAAAAAAAGPPARPEGEGEPAAGRPPTPRGGAEEAEAEEGGDESVVFGSFGAEAAEGEEGGARRRTPSQGEEGPSRASAGAQLSEAPSPAARPMLGAGWQPNQVVQYVWGQLAQAPHRRELLPLHGGPSESSTAGATSSAGTPQGRGLWVPSASATPTLDSDGRLGRACFRAFVRNTFISAARREHRARVADVEVAEPLALAAGAARGPRGARGARRRGRGRGGRSRRLHAWSL
ncbi:unnamed protein product [Prorocentrum cordatum]|uniref:Uncharacterized protein n=1 Tax=Prorocentrum cordatum TaxID=2364126 RepID=A0ABN9VFI6_9DINO|nr:unnamed protein product [Polarella glacialis]